MQEVPCNICGERRELDEIFADAAANVRVVRCRSCGLIFVNPTMTTARHLNFYNRAYLDDIPTDTNGNYTDIPPEKIAHWEKRAKGHIDYFSGFCDKLKTGGMIHVLEVGCGYAAHLEEVHRRCPGATLAAVEPNKRMHNIIRKRLPGTHILGRTLETLSGVRMLFDRIIAVDVLERTVNPAYNCRRIHTMLAKDGLCLIITHNNMASRQGHVYDLSHLYYFTEATLHALLTRNRLEIVSLEERDEFGRPGDDRVYAVVKKK